MYTEDSDFNAQERAQYVTKKFKEISKQVALPKLPHFENESSESSHSNSSGEEDEEIKKLIKSKKIKSKNLKVKKTIKNKKKGNQFIMFNNNKQIYKFFTILL